MNENIEEVVNTNETVEPVVEPEVKSEVEPEIITSTGQTKEDLEGESMKAPEIEPELPEVGPEASSDMNEEENTEEEPKPIIRVEGTVGNCDRLNVRVKPSKDSTVCYILNNGDSVMVNLEESTEDFYKVYTINMDGYCMKQFINIK